MLITIPYCTKVICFTLAGYIYKSKWHFEFCKLVLTVKLFRNVTSREFDISYT